MPVELSDEQDDPLESGSSLASLAGLVLSEERVDSAALLSVTFVDLDRIAELNRQHLGKEGPTDVLSFPIEDLKPGDYPRRHEDEPPLIVGDVVICPGVVRTHAAAAAVPFEYEMALTVVHGVLHLLGYDHEEDEEAKQMEQRERELLALVERERQ